VSLRRPLAVVLAVSVVGLTGCGVTDAVSRPGEAVRINDESISLAEVDDVAGAVCAVLRTSPQEAANVYSGSQLRTAAEQGLALRMMGDQLLEDYDLELPSTADDGAGRVRSTYGAADPEDLEAAMPAFTGTQHFSNVLIALGTEELGPDAGDRALAAGVEKAQEWQAEADIDTNPLLTSLEIGAESILAERDDLSVAVSDAAVQASGDDAAAGAADLPESQRCGG
jgi:hypothetical protein